VNLAHADVHVRDIVLDFKVKGRWHGEATIIRGLDGREYAWPRLLSPRERLRVTRDIAARGMTSEPPQSVLAAAGPIVEIWFEAGWKSRSVEL